MKTLADLQLHWQQTLNNLYPEREINNLFRFALEDLFELGYSEQMMQRTVEQSDEFCTKLENVLQRLKTGEPLQYITGFTYFDNLKLSVSPAVLIPRPETEELVAWVSETLEPGFNETIIDWCTGSGCIALALKQRFPESKVIGFDWSAEALEVAQRNAEALKLPATFELRDALAADDSGEKVAVIISNPPYIPQDEQELIRSNVRNFEPHIALFVPDESALLFYEAITQKAIRQLNPGGWLFFELHEDFAEETKQMVENTGGFSMVEIRNDLQGKARMLRAKRVKI
ncbi:MAG: protein-(glutamine-N5) methyltransferase, release factor-specific [Candidatus Fluviicola riflensis]|nr:MAG: protein-(glutamine-N5) methyltransferase, release factor-specific [Candidatus Fluviicola riflensis]OGS79143.1 MAG: protein-(glutamine-N5) methyltransferase, release factor-specific [Candidatus Fluviicola riflensis]OGS86575.1 MAG: protein-(glutamine-N5) methyltransferase, release factor-specific [Fluviicola sp. RIFCSPHIGHO2_01_FULL_43_53]OGS88951.1 MAG: protein-(glutamine-N5) methyltransferase, release factor-specific [Fluviicola sp. RIFCSPHIGHO2_12_FULL_43_24]